MDVSDGNNGGSDDTSNGGGVDDVRVRIFTKSARWWEI